MRGWNEFGPDIPNEDLTLADVPCSDAPYWCGIDLFALTFDGYAAEGFEDCAALANASRRQYESRGAVPATLTDLRRCLFFEQRRWRHLDEHPDEASERYIRRLLGSIRETVSRRITGERHT